MARQPNYGFDKRRKEQARKDKQEQKRLRKLEEAKQRATNELPKEPNESSSEESLPPADTDK